MCVLSEKDLQIIEQKDDEYKPLYMNRLGIKQNSAWCSANSLKPLWKSKNPKVEQAELSISIDEEKLDRIIQFQMVETNSI